MKRILILLIILGASCDTAREPEVPRSIKSQAVIGSIEPDTVYRGSYIARPDGICGLVLIEAGQFSEDASIRFNTSFEPPGFEAASEIRADCVAGHVTFIDLVTGQSHSTAAPASLDAAESFTREYLEFLLL